jgi:ribosome-binding protein aMBF1 (putative translation factor)
MGLKRSKNVHLKPKSINLCISIFDILILQMTITHYNRIKAALAEKGMSSKELAATMGIAEQTVSRWCTNKRQPPIEKLYEVSKVLKVDIRELLVATNWK